MNVPSDEVAEWHCEAIAKDLNRVVMCLWDATEYFDEALPPAILSNLRKWEIALDGVRDQIQSLVDPRAYRERMLSGVESPQERRAYELMLPREPPKGWREAAMNLPREFRAASRRAAGLPPILALVTEISALAPTETIGTGSTVVEPPTTVDGPLNCSPRLIVEGTTARLDGGKAIILTKAQANAIVCLLAAEGQHVPGRAMNAGKKPDRTINTLPEAIRQFVEGTTGKGYRLMFDTDTVTDTDTDSKVGR